MKEPIDIVVTWVDGKNPLWQAAYHQYLKNEQGIDAGECRYRDWGILHFLFRSIEENTPWVRKVHFITNGQFPDWLDVNHPKLHWVKHEEIIDSQYLPIFSPLPIEVSFHRIEGLAEQFIYMNDDFFMLNPVEPSFFFKKGLPRDYASMTPIYAENLEHLALNNSLLINKHFRKSEVIRSHFWKWFSLKNPKGTLNNLLLLPWKYFSAFVETHLPQPYLKSTFEECERLLPEELNRIRSLRFRSFEGINQWFFRYWQLCQGRFAPCSRKRGICVTVTDLEHVERVVTDPTKKHKLLCLHDQECDFETTRKRLIEIMNVKFPHTSTFEK